MPKKVLALVFFLLGLGLAAPALGAAADWGAPALASAGYDDLARALRSGRLSEAEYALERATALFRFPAVRDRYGDVDRPEPREATLVLRDLASRLHELAGEERERAEALLARPTSRAAGAPGPRFRGPTFASCTAVVCVHWVETGNDAPAGADGDETTVPAAVETTKAVFDAAWVREVGALGYRAPLSDVSSADNGGDGRLDVYLADLGRHGVYGACATDDPRAAGQRPARSVSVYCAVDDDFDPGQFSDRSGLSALQVTAAHEFFHAVQFGYDWLEDLWLLEGTAAWIEDEVYDHVDENRRFLAASALRDPAVPVDFGAKGFQYGSWLFWRFLSERFGRGIVRDVWERARGGESYSLLAVKRALAARRSSLPAVFRAYAVANRIPARRYAEGRGYPVAAAEERYVLSADRPSTGWRYGPVYHLSSRYFAFRPAKGTARNARLRIALDLPGLAAAPQATAMVFLRSGRVTVKRAALGRSGGGTFVARFGARIVRRVELVLGSASSAFRCWRETVFSCGGIPLDDYRPFRYRASVVFPPPLWVAVR